MEVAGKHYRWIDSKRWAQVTASEPSPTANPTRLVDPERMSPAASTPGNRRLQRTRVAIGAGPQSRTNGVGAGQEITIGIASKLGRQPLRRRFGADEYEHRRTGQSARRRGGVAFQRNLFDVTISVDGVNLRLFMDDDVGGCPDPTRQVFRHARDPAYDG